MASQKACHSLETRGFSWLNALSCLWSWCESAASLALTLREPVPHRKFGVTRGP